MKKSSHDSIVSESSTIDDTSKKIIDHTNHDDDISHHVSPPSNKLPAEKSRGKWTHNPVLLSLIACSTMHNCEEVREIYRECVEKNDKDSMLCEAAEKYFKMCHMDNGDGNTILNFNPYVEP